MPIRMFRADSAAKYVSHILHGFFEEKCTLAQFSCHGAQYQNGMAERKHWHLLETDMRR
jgi:hypothetical protein